MNEAERKIAWQHFAQMQPGWAGSGGSWTGEQISALALALAEDFLAALSPQHMETMSIYPTEEGGLQAEWRLPRPYGMEITFRADGIIELFLAAEKDEDAVLENNVNLKRAAEFIQQHHTDGDVIGLNYGN